MSRRSLESELRKGILSSDLGVSIFGPYDDFSSLFSDDGMRQKEEVRLKWAKQFRKNPFRIKFIESDFQAMTQEAFEEAFVCEPVWCLAHMSAKRSHNASFEFIYRGLLSLDIGQAMRAKSANPNLDTSGFLDIAQTIVKEESQLKKETFDDALVAIEQIQRLTKNA